MTTQQERNALYDRLREVLGEANTATMEAMFGERDDVATKGDLSLLGTALRSEMTDLRTELRSEMADLRTELRSEMADLRTEFRSELGEIRTEVRFLRQEMELKYATKADLLEMTSSLNQNFHSYVRTFMATQAATVVGVTGIVYALVRFT